MTYEEMVIKHNKAFNISAALRMMVPGIHVRLYQLEISPDIIPDLVESMEMKALQVEKSGDSPIIHDSYYQHIGNDCLRELDFLTMDGRTHAIETLAWDTYGKKLTPSNVRVDEPGL